jgi:cold-inducible RNA-binding protein
LENSGTYSFLNYLKIRNLKSNMVFIAAAKVYYYRFLTAAPNTALLTLLEIVSSSIFQRSFSMGKKLYVGNLAYGLADNDLKQLFSASGTVVSAQIIMDRMSGRSKGFGFVEMNTDEEAQAAISAFNGKDIEGRALTVNEARPKTENSGRGGSGGGGRGGYGGR